jgi:hypothetical protein
VLITNSGISKVYFAELPKEVQERFHYNAAQAAQFTATTQAASSEYNAAVTEQQASIEQRRKAQIQQQQQAVEQQRQAAQHQEQIAAQQGQRQLEAHQKQEGRIAAQKQVRDQQQRRRTTRARGDHWESYKHTFPGGYEEMSGDARMGHYHSESGRGPHPSNVPWTSNTTDTSWGPAR